VRHEILGRFLVSASFEQKRVQTLGVAVIDFPDRPRIFLQTTKELAIGLELHGALLRLLAVLGWNGDRDGL
jgi:hypothetical protein